MLHIWRFGCPVALIRKGTIPQVSSTSGVLFPTQAASSQCAFSRVRVTRLNFVKPPLPHSTGRPNPFKHSKSFHLVAFTAVASFNGAFACARMRFNTSGFFLRNTAISCVPLARLHFSQARVRLLTRSLPPLARGTICSICKGTFSFAQYAHVRPHFSRRYSRVSYPANVPCWYSTPAISGFCICCRSKRTNS